MNHRSDIDERKEEILKYIEEGMPKAGICRILRCKHSTLQKRLDEWGIDYKGDQGARFRGKKGANRKTVEELAMNPLTKSSLLRRRLIEDGVRDHRCEKCNNAEWLGGKIPLELHHIDGNRFNNALSNVQLLCPNCHSLEPNNSGAAKKKRKKSRAEKKQRPSKPRPTKIDWPSNEELIELLRTSSYLAVGRMLGVSDNAIRKRLRRNARVGELADPEHLDCSAK